MASIRPSEFPDRAGSDELVRGGHSMTRNPIFRSIVLALALLGSLPNQSLADPPEESTGKSRRLLGHTDQVYGVALSSDGLRLLSGSLDQTVRIWDTTTGRELKQFRHDGWVRCVALTADGRRALSGGDDKTIRVWDVESGRELVRFKELTDEVYGVAISADGFCPVVMTGPFGCGTPNPVAKPGFSPGMGRK
jgi:WD40 repeat protein